MLLQTTSAHGAPRKTCSALCVGWQTNRKYFSVCMCVFLSNLFIMRADKPSDRLADGLCVELLFLFRFPITSYNIFHFLPCLVPPWHTLLSFTHTHTLNYSLSSTRSALLSLTLYVRSISVLSLPAGSQWQS